MDDKNLLTRPGSRLFAHPGFDNLIAMAVDFDGFKRESAVRRLGMLGDPRAIPCLIVLANDWVYEVRAAAYEALVQMLKSGNGDAFVAALPQLLRLEGCRRADHTPLLRAIREFLLREENRGALLEGLKSPDSRVARIIWQLLVERRLMEPAELVRKGLEHGDVVVRSIALDLLKDLPADDFAALADKALRDSYMPVRREAFQQLLRRDPERGVVAARGFLFDRSAAMREIAIRYLASVGEPIEETYDRALEASNPRVAVVTCVLWAWGFMNALARSEQVTKFLDSPSPAIRRAALLCLARLRRADAATHLRRALSDASPAVCNEAARLVRTLRVAPSADALVAIALTSGLTHVALACCRVARDGNKWDWLRFVLDVYGRSACKVPADTFFAEIDAWQLRFNRSAAQPDQRQLTEIVQLVRSCRDRLSAKRLQLLEFTLGAYVGTV